MDKEGSGWTAGGVEHQDGAGRPCVWRPVAGEDSTRPHAHSRAGAWTARCRRKAARGGASAAGFRRGCHRPVDRRRAPRNMWVSAGDELPEKSPAALAAAVGGRRRLRRRGEGDPATKKKIGMKHDHPKIRFSLLALIPCEERKREFLIFLFLQKINNE